MLKKIARFLFSREKIQYDVLIVGAGPAGLSAAIRIKELDSNKSVVVIEKSGTLGGHILSGNCFQPTAMNELFPNWEKMENKPPLDTPVTEDHFHILWNEKLSFQIPHVFYPSTIRNHGNYVISLGDLCVWMGEQAQALGVDIFTSTSGARVIFDEKDRVIGVATGDMGIGKNGEKKSNYQEGIDIISNQTILCEGTRGSITERVIEKYKLRKNCEPQSYGIGLKEVWEVPPEDFKSGLVQHTVGWPLCRNTYGGSFLYHKNTNQVHLGLVVGLDYPNPNLSPYQEFQNLKRHPKISRYLKNGTCISYGARVLNEGGYFSIPKLTFPGGMLAGCSAGFLNVMKIKGSHNAMKSGMLAAETICAKQNVEPGSELVEYEDAVKSSWIYDELYRSRNFKGSFQYNIYSGLIYGAFDGFISKGREPWNIKSHVKESESYLTKDQAPQIKYEKPDGKLNFDLLDNLARSGTNHEHDQPAHLKVIKETGPNESLNLYDGPEQRFCPAKVYEFIDTKEGKKLQINAQNCLHCKTCDIKMPKDYIRWTVPEAGGGPNYCGM
ncbi:unnamed protein product [Paramecium octaurelia]|uniref:Electron transfer flavoprotein-ubiquinone oxidoreductase n=1 Tax=Paramecium octaurelia TaxID=43137 RepID=A0A8S1S9D4_PAROT|nr:unnamed protein product [Paramecium octaurelia]